MPKCDWLTWTTLIISVWTFSGAEGADETIQPYAANRFYWQYKGEPIFLIGATKDDNLFQLPDLQQHLDQLKQAGGNYIRNTMSDRHDHGFEVYPFAKQADEKYDLNLFNEEYWTRFENMLRWTHERDIIVQIEVWDRFDYCDLRKPHWLNHPFNPNNNNNYTHEQSGLKKTYRQHPGSNENPFFYTVPALKNNQVVLKYQQAKIDQMLSYSLKYPHVLYCMDNETNGAAEWGCYWANHIKEKAKEQGVVVQITEMWDSWDLGHAHHRATFDHPETYSFLDISQNNHQKGQPHWDNAQRQRLRIADHPRPLNNVKIYGADSGPFGNTRDALERFWRNIIGGAASSRFHRPEAGLGLGAEPQVHLRSARLLLAEWDLFRCQPDAESSLLTDREPNEAFLTRIHGEQYAVFFPKGGSVGLDLSETTGNFTLRWLDIEHSKWQEPTSRNAGTTLELETPNMGYWVALLTNPILSKQSQ